LLTHVFEDVQPQHAAPPFDQALRSILGEGRLKR
jgi:hypothetical protein